MLALKQTPDRDGDQASSRCGWPSRAVSRASIPKDIARDSNAQVKRRVVALPPMLLKEVALLQDPDHAPGAEDRREFLKTCGRFAVTVPPAVTVLLSTSLSSEAIAKSGGGGGGGHGGGPKGNNGVGNGPDPQPPGNPPINDGPGTGPGNPGRRHKI